MSKTISGMLQKIWPGLTPEGQQDDIEYAHKLALDEEAERERAKRDALAMRWNLVSDLISSVYWENRYEIDHELTARALIELGWKKET